jgi:hypothetical protein
MRLTTARWELGAFESVVAPIMIALVASFYRKEEQAKRIASFYAEASELGQR